MIAVLDVLEIMRKTRKDEKRYPKERTSDLSWQCLTNCIPEIGAP